MNAWWNLVKKEHRMIRNSALIQFAFLFLAGLWLIYRAPNQSHMVVLVIPVFFFFFLFYLSLYMFKNLNYEFKYAPHLWLHCPQPTWMLLGAKFFTGLLQMLVILLLLGGIILLAGMNSFLPQSLGIDSLPTAALVTELGAYMALLALALGIYFSAWVTLIVVVSAAVRNILGRFRWLAGIGTLWAGTWGMDQLRSTWVYDQLTHWGALNIPLTTLKYVPQISDSIHLGPVYGGEILFYIILTLALYFLSTWLIDNKVEV